MKIALYHHLDAGGAARLVAETASRSAHHITWFRVADGGDEAEDGGALAAAVDAVRTYRLRVAAGGVAGQLAELGQLAAVERRVARDVDAGGYDALVVHPCRVRQAPGLLRLVRTPTVYYVHELRRRSVEAGYRGPSARRAGWYRAARHAYHSGLGRRDGATTRRATRLLANSAFTAESLRARYGLEATVCRPGVDGARFAYDGGRRANAVLAVGGLEHAKGHARVVRALGLLAPADRPELHVVCGRGSSADEAHLRDLARRQAVTVHLHRAIGDEELAALYRSAAVTACAADLEPFGLTALESIACGTPVVAVDRGGYREVVEVGDTGWLAEPTEESLASAFSCALAGPRQALDEARRDEVVARWSWERTAQGIDRACTEVSR